MRQLDHRVSKLEAIAVIARRPKKRCMPDWLQSVYEQRGCVFDAAGQIVSGPRRFTEVGQAAGGVGDLSAEESPKEQRCKPSGFGEVR